MEGPRLAVIARPPSTGPSVPRGQGPQSPPLLAYNYSPSPGAGQSSLEITGPQTCRKPCHAMDTAGQWTQGQFRHHAPVDTCITTVAMTEGRKLARFTVYAAEQSTLPAADHARAHAGALRNGGRADIVGLRNYMTGHVMLGNSRKTAEHAI